MKSVTIYNLMGIESLSFPLFTCQYLFIILFQKFISWTSQKFWVTVPNKNLSFGVTTDFRNSCLSSFNMFVSLTLHWLQRAGPKLSIYGNSHICYIVSIERATIFKSGYLSSYITSYFITNMFLFKSNELLQVLNPSRYQLLRDWLISCS